MFFFCCSFCFTSFSWRAIWARYSWDLRTIPEVSVQNSRGYETWERNERNYANCKPNRAVKVVHTYQHRSRRWPMRWGWHFCWSDERTCTVLSALQRPADRPDQTSGTLGWPQTNLQRSNISFGTLKLITLPKQKKKSKLSETNRLCFDFMQELVF